MGASTCSLSLCLGLLTGRWLCSQGEHLEKGRPESMHSQTPKQKLQRFWGSLRSQRMSLVLHLAACSKSLRQACVPGRGNDSPNDPQAAGQYLE